VCFILGVVCKIMLVLVSFVKFKGKEGIFYEGFRKGGGCLNPVCDLYGCFVFFDPL